MKYLFLFFFTVTSSFLSSQEMTYSDDQQEVYDVIVRLFDGMRDGDSSVVHSVFSDDVRMYTSFEKDGELQFSQGALSSFLQAVGTPHEQVWDEKIWNTKVNVELGIASVWTDYAFYLGDQFSHCGIDAFQLVLEDGSWKIIHLMDTRRKINCEKPK